MTIDDIAITLQPHLGNKGIRHLMDVFFSAESVFAATAQELEARAGLRHDIATELVRKRYHRQAEKELVYLERNGIDAVASTDESYPRLLYECNDRPHVIYYRGNVEILSGKTVSMVGTRTVSQYGIRMSDIFVGQLSEKVRDAIIVSGLAFGVDSCCHRSALEYGLKTVAVLPCALPDVMPSQNRGLAEQIIGNGGTLITELHSQVKQNGNFYVPRNRIIAGMSYGTLVVESPREGGALLTAEFADMYNRVVMAIPGRVGDRCSEGSNRLIRNQKAAMVCSGMDVAYELGWDMVAGRTQVPVKETAVLSTDEQLLMDCIKEGETVGAGALAVRSGMSVGTVNALLLGLEIGGMVRSLPGKMYEKI